MARVRVSMLGFRLQREEKRVDIPDWYGSPTNTWRRVVAAVARSSRTRGG
ncbi:hypothetical protein Zm00014a_012295 [Zea mays]|jgi:hypothetical protein|uniref:Uncharacterized protein n=1 Tax=Zea mays TaxID=4577 RepID=A0A3L6DQV7_MAIZE|nr:hypothetical protein Zm00014a_012295 [Zea mays]